MAAGLAAAPTGQAARARLAVPHKISMKTFHSRR
jgi:hypothetical protein